MPPACGLTPREVQPGMLKSAADRAVRAAGAAERQTAAPLRRDRAARARLGGPGDRLPLLPGLAGSAGAVDRAAAVAGGAPADGGRGSGRPWPGCGTRRSQRAPPHPRGSGRWRDVLTPGARSALGWGWRSGLHRIEDKGYAHGPVCAEGHERADDGHVVEPGVGALGGFDTTGGDAEHGAVVAA